jgi:hypothetical protein
MLEIALLVGWLAFPDDGVVNEGTVGAAARHYVTRRISLGPELIVVSGSSHSHTMLTGNVTWDARDRARRMVPFLTAGGGFFQTRQVFHPEPYVSYDPAFTAGGGVRANVNRRMTVGAEARIGWELHLRTNGFVTARLFGN